MSNAKLINLICIGVTLLEQIGFSVIKTLVLCRFHYPKKISTFVTRKKLMFRSKTNTTNKKYNSVLI